MNNKFIVHTVIHCPKLYNTGVLINP